MHRIRTTTIFSSLLLFVLALHTMTHTLVKPQLELNSFLYSISGEACCSASLALDEGYKQDGAGDFKPPKHSFIDYSTFLSSDSPLHFYNPAISTLSAYEPFQAPPEVFLEIVVPPHPA